MTLRVRVPATPHRLLRANVTEVSKRERQRLPFPLCIKHANVIKALLRKELRETAGWAAREVAPTLPTDAPVMLHYVIAWEKGRTGLDFDSAVHALKGCTDALMDAGWIVDDRQVIGMTVKQEKDLAGTGYIDVTMTPARPGEEA